MGAAFFCALVGYAAFDVGHRLGFTRLEIPALPIEGSNIFINAGVPTHKLCKSLLLPFRISGGRGDVNQGDEPPDRFATLGANIERWVADSLLNLKLLAECRTTLTGVLIFVDGHFWKTSDKKNHLISHSSPKVSDTSRHQFNKFLVYVGCISRIREMHPFMSKQTYATGYILTRCRDEGLRSRWKLSQKIVDRRSAKLIVFCKFCKRKEKCIMKKLVCLSVICMLVLSTSAAFAQEKAEAKKVEPIRIGGLFALSGNAMHIGVPTKYVADMIVEHINKQGGINGRPIKLFVADTESNPSKAVAAFKRLVQKDKVVAVIGPTTTGSIMACMAAIREAKIPVVGCVGGTSAVEPVEKRFWVFKSPQKTVTAVECIYTYLKKKGIKKIALLTASNKFGQEGEQSLVRLAPDYGLTIVGKETFDVKDLDMTIQLSKLAKLNPEAVICWTVGPAGARVAKNAKQIENFKAALFQCHGLPDPIYLKLAGDAANGTYMPSAKLLVADQLPDSDPQKSLLLGFVNEYENVRKYGEVSTHSGYAWDAMQIIAKAMEKAGTDPAKVRDAIEHTKNYVGISGIYNMSPKDHCGLQKDSLVIITVKEGKWKLVE